MSDSPTSGDSNSGNLVLNNQLGGATVGLGQGLDALLGIVLILVNLLYPSLICQKLVSLS